jgi:hypothetical protein
MRRKTNCQRRVSDPQSRGKCFRISTLRQGRTFDPRPEVQRQDNALYPIGVAVMTLIVGALFLRDTKDVDIVSGSGVQEQAKA